MASKTRLVTSDVANDDHEPLGLRTRRAPRARRHATRTPEHKTYVLDTSVLLSDPRAMLRFAEHEVVLPVVVVTELEGKRHHPELGYFARQALRLLDDLRISEGRLDKPVAVGADGGTLRVELNHTDPFALPAGFRLGDNDTRILAVAKNLANEGCDVTIVSARTSRCASRRRRAVSRRRSTATSRASTPGWTGLQELEITAEELDQLYDRGRIEHAGAAELPCHTGLVLLSPRGSGLGRVGADKQIRLVRGDRDAFGLHGRSAEQRIALDLLLDPDVGIVSLGGRAGTGKSALALCAGLESVMERRAQRKVLVFRPLFAVGGQELGYLPGTEQEKMNPWGQAVFDTLGALVSTEVVEEIMDRGLLEVLPLTHIRGRSPPRRVRHRRRGPVPRAQRPAHRPLAHRPEQQGRAHARRRPARQPPGGSARRCRRRHREAQGPPALRPRHPDAERAQPDRRPRHRYAGGTRGVTWPHRRTALPEHAARGPCAASGPTSNLRLAPRQSGPDLPSGAARLAPGG